MKFKNLISSSILILFISSCAFANTERKSDSNITNQVSSKIHENKTLSGTSINVSTVDGVVVLTGNVESETQASEATEIAQSVSGVKDVDTAHLTVRGSEHPISDAMITAKIKGLFMQHKLFKNTDIAAMTIQVETNDGVVSLSGKADNREQAENAVKISKSVVGVKEVKSSIRVER